MGKKQQQLVDQMLQTIVADLQEPVGQILAGVTVIQQAGPDQAALWEIMKAAERLRGFFDALQCVGLVAQPEAKLFLSAITHEYRTPLTAIHGYTELLLQEVPHYSVYQRWIGEIEFQCYLLRDQIEILSILVHPDRVPPLEPLSLLVVQGIVTLTTNATFSQEREVRTSFPEDMSRYVLANRTVLAAAIRNFLDNALKYTPQQTPVEITLVLQQDGAWITVTDFGGGIPKRLLAGIWGLGVRGKSSVQGSGLGLHITKTTVEAAGGMVGAESIVDKGSTFMVGFPWAN